MKYCLTFLLSILGSITFSQIYFPFPTDSATWDVSYYSDPVPFPVDCSTNHYGFYGDTTINGKTYSKLYVNYSNEFSNDSSFNVDNAYYLAAISREDSLKQIYVIDANDSTEQLYYDFSLSLNDTFCFDYLTQNVLQWQSVPKRLITPFSEKQSNVTIVVEKKGKTNHPISLPIPSIHLTSG